MSRWLPLITLVLSIVPAPGSTAQEAQPPFFSLDPVSPSLGADGPADVFGKDDGGFTLELESEALLASALGNLDAVSTGRDWVDVLEPCPVVPVAGNPGAYLSTLYAWSVDRASVGASNLEVPNAVQAFPKLAFIFIPPAFEDVCVSDLTPLPAELPPPAPGDGAAADVFLQFFNFGNPTAAGARQRLNIRWIDENELGLNGLPAPLDEMDAIELFDLQLDTDPPPEDNVFFSLDPATAASLGVSPADILVVPAEQASFQVYATESQLGLQPGDDVDALCLTDSDVVFDNPAVLSRLAISLTAGSPSLAGPDGIQGSADDYSPADVFRLDFLHPFPGLLYPNPVTPAPPGRAMLPFLPHEFLSLRHDDDLDALACILGDPGEDLEPALPADRPPFPTPFPLPMLFPDCNHNGRDDLMDIAFGSSSDLNGNQRPDECEAGRVEWLFEGVAEGGQVEIEVEGFLATCDAVVATTAGQTAAEVVAALAAALEGCLVPQGVTVIAEGGSLLLTGLGISDQGVGHQIDDDGLTHRAIHVPTLRTWGYVLLAALLAAMALGRLAKQPRAGTGTFRR